MRPILGAIFSALLVAVSARVKLDKLITTCSLKDPNVNECAQKAANELLPHLVKGIRDFNFPPLDPLEVPFLQLEGGVKKAGLKLNITDATHAGMRNLEFTGFRLDFKKGHFEVDIHFPTYEMVGTCTTRLNILFLPIYGHGFCNLTASKFDVHLFTVDVDVVLKIDAQPEARDGKSYFKTEKFQMMMDIKGARMKLEGLFSEEAMNKYLNENALDVINELKPSIQITLGDLFQTLMERITAQLPADELFKSSEINTL